MSQEELEIDTSNNYSFKVLNSISFINPSPEIKTLVAQSYFTYGLRYFALSNDYLRLIGYFIKDERTTYKKYKDMSDAMKHDDFIKAHTRVTIEIYKLPAFFMNACLALELMLKSLIAYNRKYIDIDIANKQFMKE